MRRDEDGGRNRSHFLLRLSPTIAAVLRRVGQVRRLLISNLAASGTLTATLRSIWIATKFPMEKVGIQPAARATWAKYSSPCLSIPPSPYHPQKYAPQTPLCLSATYYFSPDSLAFSFFLLFFRPNLSHPFAGVGGEKALLDEFICCSGCVSFPQGCRRADVTVPGGELSQEQKKKTQALTTLTTNERGLAEILQLKPVSPL